MKGGSYLNNIDLMEYWLKSSENDYEAMQIMF